MNSKRISIVLKFFFTIINLVSSQITSLSTFTISKPSDCLVSQYYDTTRLTCKPCPANSQQANSFDCKCNQDYFAKYDNGGGSLECEKCPDGQIQSRDSFSCITCDTDCKNCDLTTSYITDTGLDGNKLTAYRCIKCDSRDSKLNKNSCNTCFPLIFSLQDENINTLTCDANFLVYNSVLVNNDGSVVPSEYTYNVQFGTELILSDYFKTNLIPAHTQCKKATRRNATACQHLANMCMLNQYTSLVEVGFDPCRALNLLKPTGIQESIYWGDLIPWITYPQSYATYISNYENYGLGNNKFLKLNFDNKCKSAQFGFYANEYKLDGTFVQNSPVEISKFQLCNYLSDSFYLASKISPFSATNYIQTCNLSVSTLLEFGKDPKIYELYLKFENGSSLLPIPVKILNYKIGNNEVNRGSERDQVLHRRFFMVESLSSKQTNLGQPKYIRYAKSFKINFQLIKNQYEGKIYPPVVEIDYDFVSTDNLDKTLGITFEIFYSSNFETQDLAMWITAGILCAASFIWAFFRTLVWNRRSGKLAPDLITLFKFVMFLCSAIGNVFFLVLIAGSIYWLIFYKGQNIAYLILPTSSQESVFIVMVVISFVLKLIDVIHLIFTQTSYDIFFIDWERPKSDTPTLINQLIPQIVSGDRTKENDKENLIKNELMEYNKISCWRTLFVANEWNELQTFRKIDPLIQLIGVLFFLKVINLEALTTADCNTSITRDPNEYQAVYSGILRIAMASSMYLGIGLFQYVFYIFFYIRCISDKIGQFVDFCSVSNISMFIMTHTQYGYYIHGRSPHGYSDVSMQQMSKALSREENDITGKRGLGQDSDQQTFAISISSKLSNEYSKVMIPIFEKKTIRKSSAFTGTEFEKRILAYSHLNKFLMGFIDNILRNLKYKIIRRNFLENILNMEFKEPIKTGYFYADENKGFERALFSGQERKLFVFDLITFLFVDYFAKNYVLAAFCVFIVVKIYNGLRNDLGRRNISRKTLVDKRFLI
ncbi:unnamed protein product [Brachionus calyciflorus]|uniref:Meckelin n=1 Tax=Brachionus calyciflorus TaxID=104777 RepID=A0A813M960_9BILA|nr:unnamed protein product [Brachionus calyciflorus]